MIQGSKEWDAAGETKKERPSDAVARSQSEQTDVGREKLRSREQRVGTPNKMEDGGGGSGSSLDTVSKRYAISLHRLQLRHRRVYTL